MKEDLILRSAIEFATQANDDIGTLSMLRESDLYAALAKGIEDTAALSAASARFDAFNADELFRGDAEIQLGRRVFRRWSRALHQFACTPDKEDQDIRTKLLSALAGKEGGAAIVAGLLVGTFGASPAVAAIIAALLLKVVIDPAVDEVCQSWEASLKEHER